MMVEKLTDEELSDQVTMVVEVHKADSTLTQRRGELTPWSKQVLEEYKRRHSGGGKDAQAP